MVVSVRSIGKRVELDNTGEGWRFMGGVALALKNIKLT